jgi:hypothetical protein
MARKAILAHDLRCAIRGPHYEGVATTIEHRPPIALHRHTGVGCYGCVMVPACRRCNLGAGRAIAKRVRQLRRAGVDPSRPLHQARVW